MIMVALGCAVAAVLLGVAAPSTRGLQARLADEPARSRLPRRRTVSALVVAVAAASLTGLSRALAGPQGAVLTVAGLIVVGLTAWLVGQRARARSALSAQVEIASACQLLASHLRVGQVPTEALAVAAQDCPVLREAHRVHDLGGDVTAVWRAQARSPGQAGLVELARAWQVSIQTGAPLSSTLEQVADSLAAEESLRAVVAGELASPRASSKVMAALPACGIALGYLLGGDPIGWLLAGPLGWACIIGGLLLASAGMIWIELLARHAAQQG